MVNLKGFYLIKFEELIKKYNINACIIERYEDNNLSIYLENRFGSQEFSKVCPNVGFDIVQTVREYIKNVIIQ